MPKYMFLIKSTNTYVVGTHQKLFGEVFLKSTYNMFLWTNKKHSNALAYVCLFV